MNNDKSYILQVKNVSKSFGKLLAVDDVSFNVEKGEILGIAGPNGAGKTTLFNCITSVPYKPDSGKIVFENNDISKLQPYEICKQGIARTFQQPVAFHTFSLEKNVEIGLLFGNKNKIDNVKERVEDTLKFVELYDKKDEIAADLTLFEIKMLMMATALATEPKILMLDEPVGGLNKEEIDITLSKIEEINNNGTTIIIVEHIMTFLMNCSNKMIILDLGKLISEGTCEYVANDPTVSEVYFGTKIV
jgi:branched-chain amino acid transport system ATP-binding protein